MLYLLLLREQVLKVLITGKNNFFHFFHFVSTWENDFNKLVANHFMVYVNQIIVLYTLNIYSAISQLHLNKTGEKSMLKISV